MSKISYIAFMKNASVEDIRKFALEYATEDDSVTIDKIAERHNMTEGTVKKIFGYAIVNCLVSYRIATLMKAKAHRNQNRHTDSQICMTPSDIYYNKLLEKRLETVKNFPNEKVKSIVDLYVNSQNLSAKEVAYSVGLSKKELNIIISKSIIFNIVDDETVVKLNSIALYRVCSKKEQILLSEILNQYKQLRNFYNSLITKIDALQFQIETLDEFASSSDDIIREDAEKELKKAMKSLADFNNVLK